MTLEELKVEYSKCLLEFIDLKKVPKLRYANYRRMQEIEEELTKQDDEIEIIITTKNTSPLKNV